MMFSLNLYPYYRISLFLTLNSDRHRNTHAHKQEIEQGSEGYAIASSHLALVKHESSSDCHSIGEITLLHPSPVVPPCSFIKT